MKLKKYIFVLLAASLLLFTAQSCFQDMKQDPPFDYPEQPVKPPVNEDGQIFHLSFEDDYKDAESGISATAIGNPGFADGKVGKAYAGAADSYLTFNLADFVAPLGSDLTVAFWYKLNAVVDRAGIVTIGPVTEGAPATAQNNRTSGIRIFREADDVNQRIKGNFGYGTADGWLDGANGDLNPASPVWKYIAMTLTKGKAVLYIDGEVVVESDLTEISWNGCDIMSIASGAPRFTEWGHLSDNSLIDEFRIYNKALTAEQIRDIIFAETEE